MIKVAVLGACGRMGSEVCKTVMANEDMVLAGACDIVRIGEKIGDAVITDDYRKMADECRPDAVVDFSKPFSLEKSEYFISRGIRPIIGATGQTPEELSRLETLCEKYGVCAMVIPNFTIGAVLMMKLSEQVAKYMPNCEIIELHHNQKIDSPSGTAVRTAKMIKDVYEKENITPEKAKGNPDDPARGYHEISDIHIHSVRLPGYVAHQEVIFGGPGQTLTIRHDSIDRSSYMPGVVMCIRASMNRKDFVYGLDKLL
ncbi:MAG: 4-hydroxy-tetrahydrodipicolinate reductase [Armatimonadetes bacterium]|nr:4-hydroxy-tetrahydrodipicolinate reductase [Candidatus Hippobium faecium]